MMSAVIQNLSGYSLLLLAVLCVWLGGHSGNGSMTKLGEGFGAAALLAFQTKRNDTKEPS